MPETADKRITQLESEKQKLMSENSGLRSANDKLTARNSRLKSQQSASTPQVPNTGMQMPQQSLFSGIPEGKALLGSWKVSGNSIRQTDKNQKFAKYAIPLPSIDNIGRNVLLQFTAKAENSGEWVGFGVHFAADGKYSASGYGLGQSYLVWVTSDPGFYKTESTYIQLYRSFNDVQMIQLSSTRIPESVTKSVQVGLLYKPATRSVELYVNGTKRSEFTLDSSIDPGNQLVLRTLGGPVSFENFSVKVQ